MKIVVSSKILSAALNAGLSVGCLALLLLLLGGCAHDSAGRANLPAAGLIVPATPAPPRTPRQGDDTETAMLKEMAYSADLRRRLDAARAAYELLVK